MTIVGPLELFQGQAVLAVFLTMWFMLQQRSDLRGFLHLPRGRWAPRVAEGIVIGVRGWLEIGRAHV